MNVLKVYLKSGFTKVYFYSQAFVGLILVANAARQFEAGGGDIFSSIITMGVGLIIAAAIAVPKNLRRNLHYLPGILIVCGGLFLYWNNSLNRLHGFSRLRQPTEYLSYAIMIFGMLQPIIDVKRIAYFSTKGIKYKFAAFQYRNIAWNEVNGIDYQDECFELSLKNGKFLKICPLYSKSMNLRAHLDQLWHNSKSTANNASTLTSGNQQQQILPEN